MGFGGGFFQRKREEGFNACSTGFRVPGTFSGVFGLGAFEAAGLSSVGLRFRFRVSRLGIRV